MTRPERMLILLRGAATLLVAMGLGRFAFTALLPAMQTDAGFTNADATTVVTALHAAYRRHPTRAGRERIAAAENALTTRGDAPPGRLPTPRGRPSSSYTPGAL